MLTLQFYMYCKEKKKEKKKKKKKNKKKKKKCNPHLTHNIWFVCIN